MPSFASIPLDWPPGTTRGAIKRCPPSLRDDAMQAAWLASAQGLPPDTAVRALLSHERKHLARKPNFNLCPVAMVRRRF